MSDTTNPSTRYETFRTHLESLSEFAARSGICLEPVPISRGLAHVLRMQRLSLDQRWHGIVVGNLTGLSYDAAFGTVTMVIDP